MDPKTLTKLAISLICHTFEFNHLKPTISSLSILSQALPHRNLDQIGSVSQEWLIAITRGRWTTLQQQWANLLGEKVCKNESNKAARGKEGHCKQVSHHSPIILVSQAQECSNLYKYIPKPQPLAHTSHSHHKPHFSQAVEYLAAPFPSVLHQEQPQITSQSWRLPKPSTTSH